MPSWQVQVVGQEPDTDRRTARSRILLDFGQELNDDGTGDNYYTASYISLELGYRFWEKLVGTVKGAYQNSDYEVSERDEDTIQGAVRLADGLAEVIVNHDAPWLVVRVGARVEFICAPGPLRTGTEAAAAHAPEVEATVHRMLLNRGCLIAPFHNMMLVSPATRRAQIDRLVAAFDATLAELFA
jgi:hypothetical protein